jgi:DNA-binding winged helix-turn-helix (wHTH) protein
MARSIQIGEWTFSPETAALWKGDVRRRLEHRAAEVLEVLCERRGETISHPELVEKVWGGRELSRNSVAVVIGDLRRAFEDDARAPRYIETIPKRGYRIVAEISVSEAPAAAAPPRRFTSPPMRARLIAALALAAAGLVLGGRQLALASRTPVGVVVAEFANETTHARYDALTATTTAMVAAELARNNNVRVMNDANTEARIRVRGSVAMWEGSPAVYLFAEDVSSGDVVWSGIASGPEQNLPTQVRAQMADFAASDAANAQP